MRRKRKYYERVEPAEGDGEKMRTDLDKHISEVKMDIFTIRERFSGRDQILNEHQSHIETLQIFISLAGSEVVNVRIIIDSTNSIVSEQATLFNRLFMRSERLAPTIIQSIKWE